MGYNGEICRRHDAIRRFLSNREEDVATRRVLGYFRRFKDLPLIPHAAPNRASVIALVRYGERYDEEVPLAEPDPYDINRGSIW